MKDCNKCKHISVTEENQTKAKEPHICTKYQKQVFHYSNGRNHDSKLAPCCECFRDSIKDDLEVLHGIIMGICTNHNCNIKVDTVIDGVYRDEKLIGTHVSEINIKASDINNNNVSMQGR